MKISAKILKWGNSMGIRLSKEQAKKSGFKIGDEVEVEIKKYTTGKDIWGLLPKKGDTEKELDEIDRLFGEY